MALGGGTYTSQNKILPGSYINVISKTQPNAVLGERGVVALPIALSWGNEGVITVTAEDFQKNSLKIFGYAYDAAEMQPFREVFKHAQKVHVYNTATGGQAASCNYATAKKLGAVGNEMSVVIQKNIDDNSKFDVSLVLQRWASDSSGNMKSVTHTLDEQTVASSVELVDNEYVTWNTAVDLAVTAGTPLTEGANGTADAASYQNALNVFEGYSFNVLVSPDTTANDLYVAFTKRLRDKVGAKFQTIVVDTAADYEGVVNLLKSQKDAIYWAAGALAGCAVNKSCTNMKYDGELTIPCTETQSELENLIKTGVFAFHKVEGDTNVLIDINSLVTYTDEKGEMFSSNQVIRVADQCANDTAKLFNTNFLGKVQNDNAGRISFWNQVLTHRRELETMRAIDAYDSSLLTVERGEKRNSVVVSEVITPISAMEKLYMTIVIN